MQITLNWTRPTVRVNGNPLPYAEISNYTIEESNAPGGTVQLKTFVPKGAEADPIEVAVLDRPVGTYYFRVKTNTLNPDGSPGNLSSVASNEVEVVLAPCTPSTCGAQAVADLAKV